MLYKNLFQLYPDNFQNNYFLLSDKLEDIRYTVHNGIDVKASLSSKSEQKLTCTLAASLYTWSLFEVRIYS